MAMPGGLFNQPDNATYHPFSTGSGISKGPAKSVSTARTAPGRVPTSVLPTHVRAPTGARSSNLGSTLTVEVKLPVRGGPGEPARLVFVLTCRRGWA